MSHFKMWSNTLNPVKNSIINSITMMITAQQITSNRFMLWYYTNLSLLSSAAVNNDDVKTIYCHILFHYYSHHFGGCVDLIFTFFGKYFFGGQRDATVYLSIWHLRSHYTWSIVDLHFCVDSSRKLGQKTFTTQTKEEKMTVGFSVLAIVFLLGAVICFLDLWSN